MNPYEILGVESNATEEQVDDAFRKLCRKYHPDTTELEDNELAAKKFIQVEEAYRKVKGKERKTDSEYLSIISVIRGVYVQVVKGLIQQYGNVLQVDIADHMRSAVGKIKGEAKSTIGLLRRDLHETRKLLEAFTGDVAEELHKLALDQTLMLEEQISQIESRIKVFDLALEKIKDLKFTKKESRPTSNTSSVAMGGFRAFNMGNW